MLTDRFVNEELGEILVSRDNYRPFPKWEDRKEWLSLPYHLKQEYVVRGELFLDCSWPSLSAVRFMDFFRNGNRREFEKLHFQRRRALSSLVVAECIEGKGRFQDDIINGIWCICEESFWGVPAHSRLENALPDISEPIIDLFAGETAGFLAWTHYLLQSQLDEVSSLICKRIQYEIKHRVLDPYLNRDDFWWMGLNSDSVINNWNPWCNSNCLVAFLLVEENVDRRTKAVAKAMRSLDKFLAVYHEDGGCDEGTTYWDKAGGALFDCLELLYTSSKGKIDVYDKPLIKEIGRFLYRSYINEDYFINFADGSAKVKISADLVYRYGRRINDQKLMELGSSAYHRRAREGLDLNPNSRELPVSLQRQLPALFNNSELVNESSTSPYIRDVWLDGIQVMGAREEESQKGLYLAAKGGHNDESHNHNDVGQYLVYYNGKPFLIDVGVETYSKKTFGSERYDIWTMQSAYHNLPMVGGIQQQAGKGFKASDVCYRVTENSAELSLNISTAYPESAKMKRWKRSCRLLRNDRALIQINDEFELKIPSDDIRIILMTPYSPILSDNKDIILSNHENEEIKIIYDNASLDVSWESISIEDDRLVPVWGTHLYRIFLCSKIPTVQAAWTMTIKPSELCEGES
ncbi:heparinase II/III domain-containing protein [Metabacillus arenae]|uniref:Heparinase II/III family protein n=1 Tax=Metabacillus arenae TaxID=2771434 RepID=A0A926NKH3_9BACI|nr:heparinase II/III family protein [Metabacillus arenae]MBD1382273.1 heparinase II/III family protein [Metabacillus arenae]